MPRLTRLRAVAALGLLLGCSTAYAQGRPDCTEVLRAYHRISGHNGAHVPDPVRVADKLGVDSEYVERCALAYGRRVKYVKTPRVDGEEADQERDLTAKEEGKEFEELGKEERDLQANIVQGDLDNYKSRDRLRGIDPDSSAEWEPYITHEWDPNLGKEWEPFLLDDDHPNEE
jgi:hypothetical protein